MQNYLCVMRMIQYRMFVYTFSNCYTKITEIVGLVTSQFKTKGTTGQCCITFATTVNYNIVMCGREERAGQSVGFLEFFFWIAFFLSVKHKGGENKRFRFIK